MPEIGIYITTWNYWILWLEWLITEMGIKLHYASKNRSYRSYKTYSLPVAFKLPRLHFATGEGG
jgi:hypothetical protein